MQVAIMSDSHDNIWNMRKAVEIVKGSGASLIVHCGDFIAPFMLKELDEAGIPVHGVFGNNDGDQYTLTRMATGMLNNITLHGLSGTVDAGGFNIGFTHYAELGAGLVTTGNCHLVCFGHTHVHEVKRAGDVTLLNPGEVMGKEGSPGFCYVDTKTGNIERVELKAGYQSLDFGFWSLDSGFWSLATDCFWFFVAGFQFYAERYSMPVRRL